MKKIVSTGLGGTIKLYSIQEGGKKRNDWFYCDNPKCRQGYNKVSDAKKCCKPVYETKEEKTKTT